MTNSNTWFDIPKLNRRIGLTIGNDSISSNLGCHCGTITGITSNFGTGYYGAFQGRNIEVLDNTKESDIKYDTPSAYSGYYTPPKEEVTKALNYLKENLKDLEGFKVKAFAEIVEQCKNGVPLWILSDVINYRSPRRSGASNLSGYIYYSVYRTADFAKYLIDNKIGYVLASPIVQNPQHRLTNNYSLNQGWFWIPPTHMDRCINVAEAHGENLFPSQEAWIEQISKDLRIDKDQVLPQVLGSNVFPEERRFGSRGINGRFAKVKEA